MKKPRKNLKDIGEFGFIDRITPGCLNRPEGVVRAIGDDAAAFRSSPGCLSLVTTDLLVEGVHFLRDAVSGRDLGYKALAVNLSDIAAMGGTAREAFVSLAVPADCGIDYLDDLYLGMKDLASSCRVNILGGDTTGSQSGLVINIAVWGESAGDRILRRDGASPGELICSTGFLGDSRAGLHLLLHGIEPESRAMEQLLRAHHLPRPHLEEGTFLAGSPGVTSAIDVSDGLSSDLGHLMDESGTGALVRSEGIPVSAELCEFCRRFGFDPVEFALAGGEDYVLLFTLDRHSASRLQEAYREQFGKSFHILGEMTSSGEMVLEKGDGSMISVPRTGWNHFSSKES